MVLITLIAAIFFDLFVYLWTQHSNLVCIFNFKPAGFQPVSFGEYSGLYSPPKF
jgi:hypothetical protein